MFRYEISSSWRSYCSRSLLLLLIRRCAIKSTTEVLSILINFIRIISLKSLAKRSLVDCVILDDNIALFRSLFRKVMLISTKQVPWVLVSIQACSLNLGCWCHRLLVIRKFKWTRL